jgi:nucleoside-diphosphate-sugar epimerase
MTVPMVLVTGATGFVGRALVQHLLHTHRFQVRAAQRSGIASGDTIAIGDIGPETDWTAALTDIDAVVHLAARVHVMRDCAADPLQAFRLVNVDGTLRLAKQAARGGVHRFVYVSSVKVNGESTLPDQPFRATDALAPQDAYGISKREAEDRLRELSAQTGMELVIVRPPLVYGPGVRANFHSLMRLVRRGLPLPLLSVRNARSMVALHNLVDLLTVCVDHPAAAGQTFLASDGRDLSIAELIRLIAAAMDKPALLLPFPTGLLSLAARIVGKPALASRLLGSLQVDIEHTRTTLGWQPVLPPEVAIKETVLHFLEHRSVG